MRIRSDFALWFVIFLFAAGVSIAILLRQFDEKNPSSSGVSQYTFAFESTNGLSLSDRINATKTQIDVGEHHIKFGLVWNLTNALDVQMRAATGSSKWSAVIAKELAAFTFVILRAGDDHLDSRYFSVKISEDAKYWHFTDLRKMPENSVRDWVEHSNDSSHPLSDQIRVTLRQLKRLDSAFIYPETLPVCRILEDVVQSASWCDGWQLLGLGGRDDDVLFVRTDYERGDSRYFRVRLTRDATFYWHIVGIDRIHDADVFELCPTAPIEVGPVLASLWKTLSPQEMSAIMERQSVRILFEGEVEFSDDVAVLLLKLKELGYFVKYVPDDTGFRLCAWPEFFAGDQSPTLYVDENGNCFRSNNGGLPISAPPRIQELGRIWWHVELETSTGESSGS